MGLKCSSFFFFFRQIRDQLLQLRLTHPLEITQVLHLRVEIVRGSVEPVPSIRDAVDSQRTANGVAELPVLQKILFREDLDSFGQTRPFHTNRQPARQVTDVSPGVLRQYRRFEQNPQVTATRLCSSAACTPSCASSYCSFSRSSTAAR